MNYPVFSKLKSSLIILQIILLALGGNILLISSAVQAAGVEQNTEHQCYTPSTSSDGTSADQEYIDDYRDDSALSSGQAASSFDLEAAKMDPIFAGSFNQEKFDQYVELNRGWYDEGDKLWYFCSIQNVSDLMSLVPFSQTERNVLDAFNEAAIGKIVFKNNNDYYALTGEECTQFNGDTCDQTKILVDNNNQPILSDGKQQTVIETCPNGNPIYNNVYGDKQPDGTVPITGRYSPLYFSDDVWYNGCWDAPKADVRILKTLTYLVTSTEYGGAGREYIKVGKILQETDTNTKEFPNDETESIDDESEDVVSSHAYDKTNPSNPEKIADALDITEIDRLRVTTEVIKRTRTGSRKSYKYKSMPVKVAWQTDEGITKSGGLPALDLKSSAEDSINLSILDMLEEYGFNEEDEDLDLSNVSLDNLGSVADYLGEHMVNQLMGGTGGKLDARDLDDSLENLGRAYLAKELGLPVGSLSEGTTSNEITENIGRVITEKSFGFASDSLKGKTPEEIFTNIGRRFLESEVFNISKNSLTPAPNGQMEMITRLGEGTIERRFRLAPQLLRGKTKLEDIQEASVKTQVIFKTKEYQYVDEALGLTSIQWEGDNPFASLGFTESDFEHPTQDLLTKKITWQRYCLLVGLRTYQSGIGVFTNSRTSERLASGDSNFIPYILHAFGVDLNQGGSRNETRLTADSMITSIKTSSLYKEMLELTVKDSKDVLVKPYSESTLLPLLTELVSIYIAGTYDLSRVDGNNRNEFNARLVQIYSDINKVQPAGWKARIQNLLVLIKPYLTNEQDAGQDEAKNRSLDNIHDNLTAFLSRIEQFNEAILSLQDQDGQSGANAALNLPASIWKIDKNGEQHLDNYATTPTDVMNAVLLGNFSVLSLLGKLHATTLITPDKAAQHNLASELLSDSSLSIFDNLSKLGITDSTLLDKGISTSEFRMIFKEGLGGVVFQKIGKQELLKVLWESAADSEAIQKAADEVEDVTETFDFYTSRIDRLTEINNKVTNLIAEYLRDHPQSSDIDVATLQAMERDLRAIKPNKSSIKATLETAENLGIVVEKYQAIFDDSKEPGIRIIPLLYEALEIVQELIAGKNLSFNQPVSSGNKSERECISSISIRAFLKGGLNFKDITIEISSCRIDTQLGLPSGSIYGWVTSKEYSTSGLELAVGYADAKNRKISNISKEDAQQRGKLILKSRIILAFGQYIPGFKQLADKYDITAADLALLLSGRGDDFIAKVGGSMLDSYMKWPAGTAGQIIRPVCLNDKDEIVVCSKVGATNARFRVMAQIGLNMLGADLDFPSTFDITAGGNFISNYGKSSISEYLGLRTNTFEGTFSNTVRKNTNQIMISALRADNFPLLIKMYELQGKIRNIKTDNEVAKNNLIRETQLFIDSYQASIIKELSDTSSPFWLIPNQERASHLLGSQLSNYNSTLKTMKYYAQAAFGARGVTSFTNAIDTFLNEYTNNLEDQTYWGQTYGDAQIRGYLEFRTRLQELNHRYSLSQTEPKSATDMNLSSPEKWGMFEKWVLSIDGVTAETISKSVGTSEIGIRLTDSYLESHLDEDSPIRILLQTFKELTKTADCGGVTVGQLIFGSDSSSCKFSGIGDLDLKRIFSDNASPDVVQKRSFLFDMFLTSIFSNDMEERLGLQKGVFRAIVIEPAKAKDILLEQGVLMEGGKLLGANYSDSDDIKVVKSALYDAYMAGFYNPETKTYTLKFNKDRSLKKLEERSYSVVSQLVQPYNQKFFGNNISVSDIQLMFSGNLNSITYLGLMSQVYQLNKGLSQDSDSHAKDFMIDYNTVRIMSSTLSDQELDRLVAIDIRKDYCATNSHGDKELCQIQNDSEFLTKYSQKEYAYSTIETRKAIIQDDFANQRKLAQDRLMYGVMDAMAFKADHSVPPGFTESMLQGTNADRLRMLGAYVINKMGIDTGFEKFGLSSTDLVNLAEYGGCLIIKSSNTSSCQLPPERFDAMNLAISKLDKWFDANFENIFGIPLPSEYAGGLMTGFFAWGQAGFTKEAFFSDKLTLMGKNNIPSVGAIANSVMNQRLFKWVDKRLGMEAGSAYAIYESYTKYLAAYKAYQTASKGVEIYDDLGEFIRTDVDKVSVDKTKAAMKEAQAAVISLAINMLFSSEISKAEEELGLVPGTGGMAVSMLVNAIMNVPISPWTVAAFILINLFGVYKVEINVRATGDGYYPIKQGNEPLYYPQDQLLGDYNAKDPQSYKAGSMLVAQNKVKGVLTDLLLMPDGDGEDTYGWGVYTGDLPSDLWISQIFTNRPEDIASLEYLIGRNSPADNPIGWGYGDLLTRVSNILFNNPQNPYAGTAEPKEGYWSGVFAGPDFWGHIHIRW